MLTWFTLLTLLTLLTLFILFKLLYTAKTLACMPTLLGKVTTLLEWVGRGAMSKMCDSVMVDYNL